jgi:predicted nucleotidyltransferase
LPNIDLPELWRDELIAWAQRTNAIAELWLFGSRAKGTSRPDSDVDIAVSLMPPVRNHDWALATYLALSVDWRRQLEKIVGRRVSLTAIVPDTPTRRSEPRAFFSGEEIGPTRLEPDDGVHPQVHI